jgi:hypothetical protein
MIKNVYMLICIIFFSCQSQTGKETKYLNYYREKTNMNNEFILTYDYWYELLKNTVYTETKINDYQKKSILTLIDRVKKDDFELLLREADESSGISKQNGLMVFFYSEGEVVNSIVGYLFSDGIHFWKSYLDISNIEETIFYKAKQINKINSNNLIALPICDENIYQEIVITINIENENISSKIGNPNHDLFDIFK